MDIPTERDKSLSWMRVITTNSQCCVSYHDDSAVAASCIFRNSCIKLQDSRIGMRSSRDNLADGTFYTSLALDLRAMLAMQRTFLVDATCQSP